MPKIEYEASKIKRKFSPEWEKSGKVNIDKKLPQYVAALIAQKKSMVEYIEELHDEVDMLSKRLEIVIKSQENKHS